MSILGNAIVASSAATQPYMEYTISSSTNKASRINLVGFTQIPQDCFTARSISVAPHVTFDLSRSPNLTKIGQYAFNYQYNATIGQLPNSVTTIETYAFYQCPITTTLPSSLTTLGTYAFYNRGSVNLSIDTFPSGLTAIPNYCFWGGLTSTSLNFNNVETIGTYAFAYNTHLTTFTGNSLTSIGANSFNGCTALTTIYINKTTPPTLSNTNAFTNCPLEHIYVPTSAVSTYQSATNWSNWSSIISAIPD